MVALTPEPPDQDLANALQLIYFILAGTKARCAHPIEVDRDDLVQIMNRIESARNHILEEKRHGH
jgi:hypothetical protein